MNHLIVYVKRYPELYNPNHADFKDQSRKSKIWKKIAYELGLEDGVTARSKWRNLRDSYVKYLRNGTALSRASNARYKNWPWAEQMEFVRPFIASKWPELANSCRNDSLMTSDEEGMIIANVINEDGPSKPKRRRSSTQSSNLFSASQRYNPSYLYDYLLQDSDADDLLFLSYSKTLRTFSKRRQMLVKSKIAEIMLDAEMHQAKEDEHVEVKFEPAEIYEGDDEDDDEGVIEIEPGPSFFILDEDDEFIVSGKD